MRTLHAAGFAAVLAATALLAPGAASADTSTTVSGTFGPYVAYDNCTQGEQPSPAALTGEWSVTLHGPSAKGYFHINVDGTDHLTAKFGGMKEAPNSTPSHFVVYGKTMAGLLTVTVNGSEMAYTVEPYSYMGLVCDSVTYPGTLDKE